MHRCELKLQNYYTRLHIGDYNLLICILSAVKSLIIIVIFN